ncbi:sugar O-acetyltransferase [Jejuia spongiicola]|nr:sugar O-acetyltransferase [Jejuia spongiicola]
MTEKEKMIAGKLYKPSNEELSKDRYNARLLLNTINTLSPKEEKKRNIAIQQLIENIDNSLYIEPPFFCEYGYNIIGGKNIYMNFNCCILDISTVTFGDNVMLAPNVQIYTATHPLKAKERNSGLEFGKPIAIGNNVWVGGNSTICPGVTLGNNVVVGAGSVVTKSFPDNVVIAGNPAKIIKTIDNS